MCASFDNTQLLMLTGPFRVLVQELAEDGDLAPELLCVEPISKIYWKGSFMHEIQNRVVVKAGVRSSHDATSQAIC